MNKPILPNFLIVGAAKCGTTSLWRYLGQHPEIFMPSKKEPRFFIFSVFHQISSQDPNRLWSHDLTDSYTEYLNLFKNVKNGRTIGEATATYLYFYKVAIPNINKYIGDVKIIIILRNPVDRAFSAYRHLIRSKLETLSFEECLSIERERIDECWTPMHHYINVGLYYDQVKAYLDAFNEVKIILYEDFKQDPQNTLIALFEFLGVDDSFEPNTSKKHNVSEIEINAGLKTFLNDQDHPIKKALRPILLNTIGIKNTEKIVNFFKNKNTLKIQNKTRRKMIEFFRDDILKLQDLIGRDLTQWLN